MKSYPHYVYFVDPHLGDTKITPVVASFSVRTGRLRFPKGAASHVVGKVLRMREVIEESVDDYVRNLSLKFIRNVLEDYENMNEYDLRNHMMQELRYPLPDELDGMLFLITTDSLAFPVKDSIPNIMRLGQDDMLATLTVYEVLSPFNDIGYKYLLPYSLILQPFERFHDSIPHIIYSILNQHYSDIRIKSINKMKLQEIHTNTTSEDLKAYMLVFPTPISTFNQTRSQRKGLRQIR